MACRSRRGLCPTAIARARLRALVRRLVVNIPLDNTDNHEKNHALVIDDRLHIDLAPAFDVLPSAQGLGYQQMRVGKEGAESSIENALSECAQFGLSATNARLEASAVAKVCSKWQKHFCQVGGSALDIDYLASFIDRDFLRRMLEDAARAKVLP